MPPWSPVHTMPRSSPCARGSTCSPLRKASPGDAHARGCGQLQAVRGDCERHRRVTQDLSLLAIDVLAMDEKFDESVELVETFIANADKDDGVPFVMKANILTHQGMSSAKNPADQEATFAKLKQPPTCMTKQWRWSRGRGGPRAGLSAEVHRGRYGVRRQAGGGGGRWPAPGTRHSTWSTCCCRPPPRSPL